MANQWYKKGQYWEPKWMGNNAITRSQEPTEEGVKAGRIVSNRSEKAVFYKPEEGTGAPQLERSILTFVAADGVATALNKDRVFKIPDLAAVIINSDGTVTGADFASMGLIRAQSLTRDAGWLFREDFTAEELEDWGPLFEAAATIE